MRVIEGLTKGREKRERERKEEKIAGERVQVNEEG